jgi:hypothetical protein
MSRLPRFRSRLLQHAASTLALCVGVLCVVQTSPAQNTPLISGGVGFITLTNGGNTTYLPILTPVLAAPLGDHVLIESRATLLETFFLKGTSPGYTSSPFLGLSYLQGDFLVSPHLTVVAGEYLTPFGTYNERLGPIWIGNFADAPLIFTLGTMGTAQGVGGMVRGSAYSNSSVNVNYAAYFSTKSTNQQFNSDRSSGGQGGIYFPNARLEIGGSYGRLLEGEHANYAGTHLWWEPADTNFKLRTEYAHGPHSQGYWLESDYRLAHFGGEDSIVGRLEPVARLQQTFRNSPDSSDGLPGADTQRVDFGLDYHLPHEVRINSSYSRQFSSTGNRNIWETGIVYRFLFPTWRGK